MACLPGIQIDLNSDGVTTYQWLLKGTVSENNSLADELVALLNQAGRPLPLAQLLHKLPAGLVATEPMLRSAAMQDERLELRGPLIKLV